MNQRRLVQDTLGGFAGASVETRSVVDEVLHRDVEEHGGKVFHGGRTPRNSVRRTLTELQARGLVIKDGQGHLFFRLEGMRDSVIHGDVLDVLRLCPSDSVPIIIADPPWSYMAKHTSHGTTTRMVGSGTRWFTAGDLPEEVQREVYRVLAPGGVFLCWFPPLQDAAEDQWRTLASLLDLGFRALREVTWIKGKGGGYGWAPSSEPCMIFYKTRRPKFRDLSVTNVLEHPRLRGADKTRYTDYTASDEAAWQDALTRYGKAARIPADVRARLKEATHACEKPVPMLLDLLRPVVGDGELVLDLYSGTGSASMAAKQLKGHFIAVELDERNVEHLIVARLEPRVVLVMPPGALGREPLAGR